MIETLRNTHEFAFVVGMATSLTTPGSGIASAVYLEGSNPLIIVPVMHCYPEAVDAPARLCWIGVFEEFRVNTVTCRRRVRSVVSTFRCLCGGLGAICRFSSFWRHGARRKGLQLMGKMKHDAKGEGRRENKKI
jgi:hypothetical protein